MDDLSKRHVTRVDVGRLKAAVRHGVEAAGGGSAFKERTRVNGSTLSEYQNAIQTDKHMPIDVVVDLEREIGEPVITRILAELAGYALVPVGQAEVTSCSVAQVMAALGQFGQSSSDVSVTIIKALEDGKITPNEQAEIFKSVEALKTVRSALERVLAASGDGS